MRYWSLLLIILLIANILIAQDSLKQGDVLYVKAESENLRVSPNGTVITQLPQASRVTVLGQQGKWVAVQIVGWMWQPSLINDRDKIEGYAMKALHIMVKTEQEANEIKSLLNKGSDFSTLAKERSIGPNAKKGGDLGIIHKGDWKPELDQAIRSLKVGQVSNVVKSDAGFHIFKRTQ